MATANEIFSEAVSVVPLVHAPVNQSQNALIVGAHAGPAAGLAARFPSFKDIAVLDGNMSIFNKNSRIRKLTSTSDLPPGWTADLIVVAEPSIPDAHVLLARAVSNKESVIVFAVNEFSDGGIVRKKIAQHWKYVKPYREHLPRQALFIMASDSPIKQQRKVPDGTKRLQKKFLPALFTLAKDEYQLLYGAT